VQTVLVLSVEHPVYFISRAFVYLNIRRGICELLSAAAFAWLKRQKEFFSTRMLSHISSLLKSVKSVRNFCIYWHFPLELTLFDVLRREKAGVLLQRQGERGLVSWKNFCTWREFAKVSINRLRTTKWVVSWSSCASRGACYTTFDLAANKAVSCRTPWEFSAHQNDKVVRVLSRFNWYLRSSLLINGL
jgi:hypothetical protein